MLSDDEAALADELAEAVEALRQSEDIPDKLKSVLSTTVFTFAWQATYARDALAKAMLGAHAEIISRKKG